MLAASDGLSISEVLKRGLQAHAAQAEKQVDRKPYDIYRELDLGLGGDARAPAREAEAALAHLIRRKHPR
ncbi:hypothetical protein BDD21_0968 [Thiocapsa rosea]|uniref:Uncharacterized protein n=1 Tax=Thiocapsa rosea TaxID=69360 RepID=A0A495V2S4_9GAMM|nr:hypothetical protein BDD21_0968 [Thiocapsa rosea]